MTRKPLGWVGIVRLGLVQSALGSIVVLTTSTLNRVMAVELALPVMLPAALVAWHYVVQLSRPRWGHGSDMGQRRTPWIVGGMGVLALGALLATNATAIMASSPAVGIILALIAFSMIGGGVGAAGTSLLALLATRVVPARRPAAAAITWIMMIVGIVITAGVAGALLDPFSMQRLAMIASGIAFIAFTVTLVAVMGVEGTAEAVAVATGTEPRPSFGVVLRETLADPQARRFGIFVFVSMLAYSAQDLILEPFAGLVFGMTPGQSTQMSSVQHGGVLLGMILVGAAGGMIGGRGSGWMRGWTVLGCAGSAVALFGLAMAAEAGPGWPIRQTVFALGFFNGIFAVAAIGSMMGLAGAGQDGQTSGGREGIRMGVWGAAQAIAFAAGGFFGAVGVDVGRQVFAETSTAFLTVFAVEGLLFIVSAGIALTIGGAAAATRTSKNFTPPVGDTGHVQA
ncbi:BCD family MFS transporter [Brevundimonas variabilis]|uniref:BCD family chlorophyll transporter-like MFS transporter n=1 Tax=Brevundimonas variabilis TaxID=74312 RepID=A0A7W9CIB7_9CAUL|nr:BCD family MFS transporter [Brevundimonas variabilis]MBB5746059.1 BCD family chlorophyll transporter-like MFS transporter [Brevundimonas variabilis]